MAYALEKGPEEGSRVAVAAAGSLAAAGNIHSGPVHTIAGAGSTPAETSLAGPAEDSDSWEAVGNSTFLSFLQTV